MRTTGLALGACVMLALTVRAEDKPVSNADKLIGTWEFVKSKEKVPIPFGTTFAFTKDGKLTVILQGPGSKEKLTLKGTYKVDGKKVMTSLKGPDGKEESGASTIKTLTRTMLVLEDKNGYVLEFKRKAKGGK